MRPEEYKTQTGTIILDYLQSNRNKSVSAQDIAAHLKKCGNEANITTVYRRLDKLVAEKKVLSHSSDDGKKNLYQYTAGDECLNHIHFQCTSCKKIFHLACKEEKGFTKHIEKEHGLQIDFTRTILYGLCAECRS